MPFNLASTNDESRKPTEYSSLDELYNPVIHRINQAIRIRAVHPDSPIGPPAEILLRFSKPPETVLKKAQSQIKTLIQVAEVKKGTRVIFSSPYWCCYWYW
jgi:ATP-dependent DNA helicase 2 subunit 2